MGGVCFICINNDRVRKQLIFCSLCKSGFICINNDRIRKLNNGRV